jgi:hypothetical protein
MFSLLNPNRKTAQADYISSREVPEPFRLETKTASQSIKGQKTFLLRSLSQHKKLFVLKPPN